MVSGHRIGATTIRVVQQSWIDAPVDALVLSANNHLWLRNASGNAAALHRRCPDLHDEVMVSVPAGGLRPGEGLVTRGPGPAVIHAVTVSYYRNGDGPVAGTSSVAAACEYALYAAAKHGFRSLAFSPMALRGHAKGLVPTGIAPVWLPAVQAGVMVSFLATDRAPKLERIDFCIDEGNVLAPATTQKWFRRTVVQHMLGNKSETNAHLAVNMRVRVYPGTDAESLGVIVEDFGDLAGQAVDLGGCHIAPARQWAVQLDSGGLVFVNTNQLVPE